MNLFGIIDRLVSTVTVESNLLLVFKILTCIEKLDSTIAVGAKLSIIPTKFKLHASYRDHYFFFVLIFDFVKQKLVYISHNNNKLIRLLIIFYYIDML